jgi:hypothetical protein
MRSKSRCVALLAMLFFSCHLHTTGDYAGGSGVSDSLAARIRGTYNGHFKQGMVTIVLNYLSDNIVSGYDLQKEERRNINGTVLRKGGQLEFTLKEPGNQPMDGTFYLSMDTASRAVTGRWVPQGNAKADTGWLALKRWDRDTSGEYITRSWNGDLGSFVLDDNGTCAVTYTDPGGSMITIYGDYEQKRDTFFIDWQPNHHLPAQQMRLVKYPYTEGSGDKPDTPPCLRGNGVKFTEIQQAG